MVRLCTVLLLASLTVFALLEFSDAARGRGGGSRSGGSRGGSRSGGSRSRSGSRSKSRSSGSSSKPKVTKYTPIKATTSRSPVIVRQTKVGSRSNTFTKVVVGYVVLRHAFATAPVYRRGYPMYRSYVTIPDERAIRVTYEEEKLLGANGSLCLGQSLHAQNYTMREGIGEEDLVELNTTVKYKKTGLTKMFHGDTISLEDIKEQEFEVTTRARYNTTIINGTSCMQVEKIVQGTMITMYETNPNTASTAHINNKLIATIIALFAVIHALGFSIYL